MSISYRAQDTENAETLAAIRKEGKLSTMARSPPLQTTSVNQTQYLEIEISINLRGEYARRISLNYRESLNLP